MRSSTLILFASVVATVIGGGTKPPCTGGKSATAAGELGASETISSTTTSTSTITVCPSCTHKHPHPSSKSTGAGELTSKSKPSKTKPTWVPTTAPTTLSSKAGGYWTSAAYGNHSTTTTEIAKTTVAGVSTSAGKTAPAPTSSLTAGGGRVEIGWIGGALVGMVAVVAGLL